MCEFSKSVSSTAYLYNLLIYSFRALLSLAPGSLLLEL